MFRKHGEINGFAMLCKCQFQLMLSIQLAFFPLINSHESLLCLASGEFFSYPVLILL